MISILGGRAFIYLFIFVNRRNTRVINVPDGYPSRSDKHPRISLSKGKEILILSPAAIYGRHPVSGLNAIHKSTAIAEKLAAHSFLPSSLSSFVPEIRQGQQVHRTTINEPERDMIIGQRNGVTAD